MQNSSSTKTQTYSITKSSISRLIEESIEHLSEKINWRQRKQNMKFLLMYSINQLILML